MNGSDDIPAPSTPLVSTIANDGTRTAMFAGSMSIASWPVRIRSTRTLSMVYGVDDWLLIADAIVLGVYSSLAAASKYDVVLREYGFGYIIVFMLLLISVINIIGVWAWLVTS